METTTTQKAAPAAAEPVAPRVYTPLADVLETNDAYVFYLDVPGAKAGEVEITYEEQTLTVEAKAPVRQAADQGYVVQQYGVGPYRRTFRLATPVNAAAIRAELKNGELILTVPKAESARTRKISIATA